MTEIPNVLPKERRISTTLFHPKRPFLKSESYFKAEDGQIPKKNIFGISIRARIPLHILSRWIVVKNQNHP